MRQAGFTLIELLLASTLSVLLCSAAALILGTLARDVHTPVRGRDGLSRLEPLVSLVRQDLEQATRMTARKDSILLYSFRALLGAPPLPRHRPVILEYRFQNLRSQRVLVRRQFDLEDLTSDNVSTEPVTAAITHFLLRPGVGARHVAEDVEATLREFIQRGDDEEPPRVFGPADVRTMAPVPDFMELCLWPQEAQDHSPIRIPITRS